MIKCIYYYVTLSLSLSFTHSDTHININPKKTALPKNSIAIVNLRPTNSIIISVMMIPENA